MQGALIFAEVCDLDDAVCIDVNSAYPNAMRNTGFSVPMKQGDFSRITEFPEFISFGIYRCIIKKSGNRHTDKLFRFNKTNKYTHIDIANAKQLGLKVTLVDERQIVYFLVVANASMDLVYSNHSLTFCIQ